MNKLPPNQNDVQLRCCGGFVVFARDRLQTLHTILVRTPNTKDGGGGKYGFPKGKFNKIRDKTHLDTASRELLEESSLTLEDIEIIPNLLLKEFNQKGNLSVAYYVAKLKTELEQKPLAAQDPEELASVEYVPVQDALRLRPFVFYERRQDLLKQAMDIYLKHEQQSIECNQNQIVCI